MRMEGIRGLMNIEDEGLLTKTVAIIIRAAARKATAEGISRLPYTEEEKIASVRQAMDEIRSGSTHRYTIDEMRAKHPEV